MALTELTASLDIITALPDQPSLSATDLKKEFDEGTNIIKDYINDTLTKEQDAINATIPTYALTSGTVAKTAEDGEDGDVYLRYS